MLIEGLKEMRNKGRDSIVILANVMELEGNEE